MSAHGVDTTVDVSDDNSQRKKKDVTVLISSRTDEGDHHHHGSLSSCNPRACNSRKCTRHKKLTSLIVLLLISSATFAVIGRGTFTQLLQWLENLPPEISLAVFIVLFVLISYPFGFGYMILNMAAGYIYGFVRGETVVIVSVAIGFTVSFWSCRICFKHWAVHYLSSSPTIMALMKIIEGTHGLKVILIMRLTLIPYGLQNTLFAMTDVKFTKAFSGTMIGLLPTQLLNTYMGSTLRNMKELLMNRVDSYLLLSIQIIISIMISLYLFHRGRFELSKLTTQPPDVESGQSKD